jgi:threonine aldolase
VRAISALARPRKMKLHMDGARFANAVAGLGVSPAELTWKSGVDVMSFGGTKNGGLLLEAVVFFDTALAEDFLYRRMRAGQLVSKSRYLGAQMLAYLENDLWLDNARKANASAKRLAQGLARAKSVRMPWQPQVNEVFAVIPRKLNDALHARGVVFFDWMPDSLGPGGIGDDEIFVRFVLSYATPEADIEKFIRLIAEIG